VQKTCQCITLSFNIKRAGGEIHNATTGMNILTMLLQEIADGSIFAFPLKKGDYPPKGGPVHVGLGSSLVQSIPTLRGREGREFERKK
jgi:hypothetical protein